MNVALLQRSADGPTGQAVPTIVEIQEWRPGSSRLWRSFQKGKRHNVQFLKKSVQSIAQVGTLPLKSLTLFPSEPFVFGPWMTTEFCTETCGGDGRLLEQRSCTPLHPDKSCASLSSDQTLRPGNKTCGEGQCEGIYIHPLPS